MLNLSRIIFNDLCKYNLAMKQLAEDNFTPLSDKFSDTQIFTPLSDKFSDTQIRLQILSIINAIIKHAEDNGVELTEEQLLQAYNHLPEEVVLREELKEKIRDKYTNRTEKEGAVRQAETAFKSDTKPGFYEGLLEAFDGETEEINLKIVRAFKPIMRGAYEIKEAEDKRVARYEARLAAREKSKGHEAKHLKAFVVDGNIEFLLYLEAEYNIYRANISDNKKPFVEFASQVIEEIAEKERVTDLSIIYETIGNHYSLIDYAGATKEERESGKEDERAQGFHDKAKQAKLTEAEEASKLKLGSRPRIEKAITTSANASRMRVKNEITNLIETLENSALSEEEIVTGVNNARTALEAELKGNKVTDMYLIDQIHDIINKKNSSQDIGHRATLTKCAELVYKIAISNGYFRSREDQEVLKEITEDNGVLNTDRHTDIEDTIKDFEIIRDVSDWLCDELNIELMDMKQAQIKDFMGIGVTVKLMNVLGEGSQRLKDAAMKTFTNKAAEDGAYRDSLLQQIRSAIDVLSEEKSEPLKVGDYSEVISGAISEKVGKLLNQFKKPAEFYANEPADGISVDQYNVDCEVKSGSSVVSPPWTPRAVGPGSVTKIV